MVAAKIARQEAELRADELRPEDPVEPPRAAAEAQAGPQLVAVEEAEQHRLAWRADGVEAALDGGGAGDRDAGQTPRPGVDGTALDLLAHQGEEREDLRGEVVFAAQARSELLEDPLERAGLEDDRVARVVSSSQGLGREGPVARGVVEP